MANLAAQSVMNRQRSQNYGCCSNSRANKYDLTLARFGPNAINSYLDGNNAVAVLVFARPGTNGVETAHAVQRTMRELRPGFPAGVDYTIAYNPTRFVEEQTESREAQIKRMNLLGLVSPHPLQTLHLNLGCTAFWCRSRLLLMLTCPVLPAAALCLRPADAGACDHAVILPLSLCQAI